jgi:hypothetical protein
VVHAADRAVLVPAEVQRRAAVRAVLLNQAHPPGGVTERDQVLAQQPHPLRGAAGLGNLGGQAGRRPVPPEQVTHQRPGSDPGQDLVLFRSEHDSTPNCPGSHTARTDAGPSFSPSHRLSTLVNF